MLSRNSRTLNGRFFAFATSPSLLLIEEKILAWDDARSTSSFWNKD
jgi:hypothetical protein